MSAAAELPTSETTLSETPAPEVSAPDSSQSSEPSGIAGGEAEPPETPGEDAPEGISSAGSEPEKGPKESGEDEGKTEDDKAGDDKEEKDPVLDAVPEKSDGYKAPEVPEGFEGDDDMLSIYNEGAHKNGLSERQHKGILADIVQPALEHLNAKTEEARLATVAGWKTELGSDKALATSDAKAQIADARNGFAKAHPEHAEALMQFLKDTEIQFHAPLNAMFAYTGSLLGEGRMRPGKDSLGGGSTEPTLKDRAETMFPVSSKQARR